MTNNEMIKRLTSECWFKTGGKGDHEKFKHPKIRSGFLAKAARQPITASGDLLHFVEPPFVLKPPSKPAKTASY